MNIPITNELSERVGIFFVYLYKNLKNVPANGEKQKTVGMLRSIIWNLYILQEERILLVGTNHLNLMNGKK